MTVDGLGFGRRRDSHVATQGLCLVNLPYSHLGGIPDPIIPTSVSAPRQRFPKPRACALESRRGHQYSICSDYHALYDHEHWWRASRQDAHQGFGQSLSRSERGTLHQRYTESLLDSPHVACYTMRNLASGRPGVACNVRKLALADEAHSVM